MAGGAGAGLDAQPLNPLWGPVTATIDWCEQNYVWFDWVAEFWNSFTNAGMFLLSVYGVIQLNRLGNIEARYYIGFAAMILVAFGSLCFHGTLRYDMQLLDELPMLYGAAIFIYCIMEDEPRDKFKRWLPLLLASFCLGITLYYVFIFKDPMFHEVAYGVMVVILTLRCLAHAYSMKKEPVFLRMWVAAILSFVFAWFLWNIDNQFCTELRELRKEVGPVFAPLLELHGWWHILTGYSSYVQVIFAVIVRERVLGRRAVFGFHFGILPFVKRLPGTVPVVNYDTNNNNHHVLSTNGKTNHHISTVDNRKQS